MEKNKKIVVFSVTFLCCFAYSLIQEWWKNGVPSFDGIIFGIVNGILVLTSLYIGNIFFQKIFTKPVTQIKKIIIPAYFFFVLIILLLVGFFAAIGDSIYLLMGKRDFNYLLYALPLDVPYSIKMYSGWVVVGSALFFIYMIWRKAMDREQRLREENLQYRYRTLKTQINPHFLFNSLNTLSEIVYVDPKKADNYIQKLSGIYRYILENEETDSIPLNKELDFVRQYFSLQQERDGDKIRIHMDVKDPDKYSIIPVSLQLLVENALKHNAVSEEKPLVIEIYRDNNHIIVSNTLQLKNSLTDSTGMGLSNLKERVRLITGEEVCINQDRTIFEVKLPLMKIKG